MIHNNNNICRRLLLILLVHGLDIFHDSRSPSAFVNGLPHHTRGKSSSSSTSSSSEEDHLEDVAQNVGGVMTAAESIVDGYGDITEIQVPTPRGGGGSSSTSGSSRRNLIVEKFFDSPYTEEEDDIDITNSNTNQVSLDLFEDISLRSYELNDFLIHTRRTLHRVPELMYNEKLTSTYIQSILKELNIDYTTGWAVNTHDGVIKGTGGYGIVADIGTGDEPCVVLRADMDALPIYERTQDIEDFKSTHDGKMHACGHDGHTTMLLGAITILKEMEDSINGTVRFMFQPAEEGGAGAKRMREEGLLNLHPKPQHGFALHVWPT